MTCRRTRSATWRSSATVVPARPRWPRRCCTSPARSPRMGKVEDGTTSYDFDPEEQRRKISVSLAVAPVRVGRPQDQRARRARLRRLRRRRRRGACGPPTSPSSSCPRSRASRSRPRSPWRLAEARGMPRAIFVNKLDRERASFERTLDDLKDKFGAGVAPLELPIGEEADVPRRGRPAHRRGGHLRRRPARDDRPDPRRHGDRGARRPRRAGRGHRRRRRRPHGALPRRREDRGRRARAHARRRASPKATVFPVLCGSATKLVGVDRLARLHRRGGPRARHGPRRRRRPAAFVFKTIVDPYVGRVEPVQGAAGHGQARRHARQRPHRHRRAAPPAHDHARQGAGPGRPRSRRRHRRRRQARPTRPPATSSGPGAPSSTSSRSSRPSRARDRDQGRVQGRRGQARQRAAPPQDEDPALARRAQRRDPPDAARGAWARPTSASRSSGWQRKFGVEVDTEDVKVAVPRDDHRARPRPRASTRSRPAATASSASRSSASSRSTAAPGFEFADAIVGGAIPRQFIPAVEKGVHETMDDGGVFGYPGRRRQGHVLRRQVPLRRLVGDELQDGGLDRLQGRDGQGRSPILLEPISELVVTAPEANQGDVMGDLNSKRGRIQGIELGRRRRGRDRRLRADLRDAALRDRPALHHRRARALHDQALPLRPACPRTSSTSCGRRQRTAKTV